MENGGSSYFGGLVEGCSVFYVAVATARKDCRRTKYVAISEETTPIGKDVSTPNQNPRLFCCLALLVTKSLITAS